MEIIKKMSSNNLLIYYAIALQLTTGILFLSFPRDTLLVARLGVFQELFTNSVIGGLAFITAALLPIINIKMRPQQIWVRLALHFPQLFFLVLSQLSILNYIILGHYADGVVRPRQFIFIDQMPSVFIGVFYLFALVKRYYERDTYETEQKEQA